MPKTEIDADTTIYTFTADFAGYTLEDYFLGNNCSAADFAHSSVDDVAADIIGLVDTEGYHLSEADALQAREDGEHGAGNFLELEAFTPRDLAERIIEMGREELGYTIPAEETGSTNIAREYAGKLLREVSNNGENGDRSVTLYECEDGTFVANTNGDPIWESDFNAMGIYDVDAAAEAVTSKFAGIAA